MFSNLDLILLPALKIKPLPNNQVRITRKFIEAVQLFQSIWPRSVKVLIEEDYGILEDIDQRVENVADLPFEMELINYDSPELANKLRNGIVLASTSYRQNHISELCQTVGSPCVYAAEYTLKTRRQIVDVSTGNALLSIRRRLWEEQQERRQQRAIAIADGVQCNGVPIYEAYRSISRSPMLFLDTRITDDLLATPEQIAQRYQGRSANEPLRLAFSGRLNKMKGADHLLDVAYELRRLGVNFHLYISGAGAIEAEMQERISRDQLENYVTMMGVPDFKTQFLPFVKSNIDLFVCCHRQGDPSCTYIETMACGVPIVGYDNEAFEGLSRYSQTGWLVNLNQPKQMARKIAELNRDRQQLQTMALASLSYARQHTFLQTFQMRADHLQAVVQRTKLQLPSPLSRPSRKALAMK